MLQDKEFLYSCNLKEYITIDGVTYNGKAQSTYKYQFQKHHNSVKYEKRGNSTKSSKRFWEIKRKGIETIMSVIDHAKPCTKSQ